MAQVDEAVRRVLLLKFRLGLFERPYTPVTSEKERFFRPKYGYRCPACGRIDGIAAFIFCISYGLLH